MKRKWILQFIGVALFVYILLSVDYQLLGQQLKQLNVWWLLLAAGILTGVYLLKSLRWMLLLNQLGIMYSYKNALLAFTSANFIAFVSPGRLGEVAKSVYVKNDINQPISYTLPTVILDRIFDVYTLLFFALFGILKYSVFEEFTVGTYILIGLLLVFPVLLINRHFLKLLEKFMIKRKLFKPVQSYLKMFAEATGRFNFQIIVLAALITIIAYIVLFFVAQSVGRSMDLQFSLLEYAMFISVANILSFLPISIAGLGTREASLIFLFGIFGLASEVAVLYSMLIFLVFYVIGGFFGYLCFLIKPLDLKKIISYKKNL